MEIKPAVKGKTEGLVDAALFQLAPRFFVDTVTDEKGGDVGVHMFRPDVGHGHPRVAGKIPARGKPFRCEFRHVEQEQEFFLSGRPDFVLPQEQVLSRALVVFPRWQ